MGLGWWASPEAVFFLVPSALLFLGAVVGTWKARGPRFWSARIGVSLIGAAVGALPWLWANVPNGFPSLDSSRVTLSNYGGYVSHLRVFFVDGLPLQLGLHRTVDGRPLLPGVLGLVTEVLVLGALVLSIVVCLVQGGAAAHWPSRCSPFPSSMPSTRWLGGGTTAATRCTFRRSRF